MPTISINYLGDLRTEATHLKSGKIILTDAPVDNQGKGEAFSPTDLVCSSLGSCMMTIMGIASKTHQINISDVKMEITKYMTTNLPRKIDQIEINIQFGENSFTEKEKKILENAAHTCPVALSLHPDIKQILHFKY